MPLVPKTKMANISKLISLGNLLVRKVTWLVLTTMSATLILSHTFGADCMTRIAYIYSCLPRIHSFPFRLTETTHTLFLTFWLPEVNPTKMYTFCNLFLFSSAFSCSSLEHNQRNFIKHRKRQTANLGENTYLLGHVAIFLYINTSQEILSPHSFYSLQDTFNI